MRSRLFVVGLVAAAFVVVVSSCANGQADVGGPGVGGTAIGVGGKGGSDSGQGGSSVNGGSWAGGAAGAGEGTSGGSGGTSASGGTGPSGGTGASGGTSPSGGTGGSAPGGGGVSASGGTSAGGGSGGTAATGGTGGGVNVIPSSCAQAHGSVGCCGPDNQVYFWGCGTMQGGSGYCGASPCGWDPVNGYYSCGYSGSDPSGTYPRDCGLPNPDPAGCPGAPCCQGYCEDQSPLGCWCDFYCPINGDCCPDACSACGNC